MAEPHSPVRDLVTADLVLPLLRAKSKKQVLADIAEVVATKLRLQPSAVFEALLQRERLGSTGVGRGIAIPHARLPSIRRVTGLFARLDHPIPFEALDDEPVDLVFLLISPEDAGGDHLKALARVARLMRHPTIVPRLRASRDRAALYSVLTEPLALDAA